MGSSVEQMEACLKNNMGSSVEQTVAVLGEWRESDEAARLGVQALDYLMRLPD